MFLLLKGEALVWVGDERHERSEGGAVHLPRSIPHRHRVTSDRAGLLLIAPPAGIEEMFRQRPPTRSAPHTRTQRNRHDQYRHPADGLRSDSR
ncbi:MULTISPECIES: cupin domain-containing protein [unclassified Streptomyces]|uniref:cupin domain-containing protein n=1 Tax=unclassified Streptomyces TaxID=2593676 RepID=UPI001F2F07E1|nr:cupin domain-containing protein [Streptomyces sp. NRRL F-2747]